MSVLALNLDVADVVVVRSVLRAALDGCSCGTASGRQPCDSCQTVKAVLEELDSKLERPSTRVPVMTLLALEQASDQAAHGGAEGRGPMVERLRLVVQNQLGTGR